MEGGGNYQILYKVARTAASRFVSEVEDIIKFIETKAECKQAASWRSTPGLFFGGGVALCVSTRLGVFLLCR